MLVFTVTEIQDGNESLVGIYQTLQRARSHAEDLANYMGVESGDPSVGIAGNDLFWGYDDLGIRIDVHEVN